MTEEQEKLYQAQREAEDLCDGAYYTLEEYMRTIGKGARKDYQTAFNQAKRDLGKIIGLKKGFPNVGAGAFIDNCIDLAKVDPETGKPIPYAYGYRTDEHWESGYAWAVFHIKDLPSSIDLFEEDLAYNLSGWTRHYSGPGRSFSSDPYYVMGRTRVLVKQFRGLDI